MAENGSKSKQFLKDFHSDKGIRLTFRKVSPEDLEELYKISDLIISEKNIPQFKSLIHTVLKELIQNAVKATQKRVYYRKNGIDIQKSNSDDIDKFKESFTNGSILALMEEEHIEFAAEVCFIDDKDSFKISVRNHGEMNSVERKNVDFMFNRGKDAEDVSDLLGEEISNKEGGGLGLSMIMILMKKLSIPSENLFFRTNDSFTVFNFIIPYNNN